MLEKNLCSIVIPAFNRESFISQTLESLFNDGHRPLDIIVVDDGSSDSTAGVAEAWWHERSHDQVYFRLVTQRNQGAPCARNHGLSLARGEFVLFLDADDLVEGGLISGLVSVLQSSDAYALGLGPTQKLSYERGTRGAIRQPLFKSNSELLDSWVGRSNAVEPCSVMWKTEFVRAIGGWRANLLRNQDGELVARAIFRGANFGCSVKGCGVYVMHNVGARISESKKNLIGLIDAGESMLAEARASNLYLDAERIIGRYFYIAALRCCAAGQYILGEQALAKSRELGFNGHSGPMLRRLMIGCLGLRWTYKLIHYARATYARIRLSAF